MAQPPSHQDVADVGDPGSGREFLLTGPRARYAQNLFDTTPHREWTRIALTGAVVAFYLVLVAFVVWRTATSAWDDVAQKQMSFVATTFLAPLGTLVGAIIGFYFARQTGKGG